MNPHLGAYVKHAKQIGLKVSIVTNGSLLTTQWLESFGSYIDQIGVSCDSLDEKVNKSMGRGFGSHVKIMTRCFDRIKQVNAKYSLNISIKLNTVVMRQNAMENWSEFLLSSGVKRWKIFKVLHISGENDDVYDDISVSESDFQCFIDRHSHLVNEGILVVPEDNDAMEESYIMISPDGRFYQNTNGAYIYSSPILQSSIHKALGEVNFDYVKYSDRGGNYSV